MVWTSLFFISIAQGLFLISMLIFRGSQNIIASRLIIAILSLMIVTNLAYIVVRTDLKYYMPQLFGLPFGMIFLFGPLFFLYSKAIIAHSFRWEQKLLLHFIPYFAYLLYLSPFFLIKKQAWLNFVNVFLSGALPIRFTEKIMFALQDLHFFIYLILTFQWLKSIKNSSETPNYIISISSRIKWLKALLYCFALFALMICLVYIFLLFRRQ